MKHLENTEVLIQTDEDYPNILRFTWQAVSIHQDDLIKYNNLLIGLAKEHGYRYVLFNSKELRNVVQDDVMALFQWSMQWYKNMANAGVDKAAYIVHRRSQFGEEKDGLKVNDLLTIEEAYAWLLS